MTAAAVPAGRESAVDLALVRCEVTVTRPLFGASNDPGWTPVPAGIAEVDAKAMLHTFDDDTEDEDELVIARASAYTVDLDRAGNVLEALDRIGEEVFSVAEEVLSGDDIFDMLGRRDDLGAGGQVDQLVIVEDVVVDEAYRGQRLGPRLLTTLIDTVTGPGFFTLIVLRAQPFQWEELSDFGLRSARKKIAASYEGVGFAHFRNGIYWRHNAYVGTESLEDDAAPVARTGGPVSSGR